MSFYGMFNLYPTFSYPYALRTMPVTIGHQNYNLPLIWVLNQEQRISEADFRKMIERSVSGYINQVINDEGGKDKVKGMETNEKFQLKKTINDTVMKIVEENLKQLLDKKIKVDESKILGNKYSYGASTLNSSLNQMINSVFN